MDNADDLDHNIAQYFPSGNRGALIITSRSHDTCQLSLKTTTGAAEYEIEKMETEEALSLLQKVSGQDVSDKDVYKDASTLVNELGYLALAIDQARSYV